MKGFTLIELMIVIAIMGIFATFAVPTYRHHIVKARISEGLHLSEMAKLAVMEVALSEQTLPDSDAETHYKPPQPTENIASIHIEPQGVVVVTYTQAAGLGVLKWIPTLHDDGEITWTCDRGTLLASTVPSVCR